MTKVILLPAPSVRGPVKFRTPGAFPFPAWRLAPVLLSIPEKLPNPPQEPPLNVAEPVTWIVPPELTVVPLPVCTWLGFTFRVVPDGIETLPWFMNCPVPEIVCGPPRSVNVPRLESFEEESTVMGKDVVLPRRFMLAPVSFSRTEVLVRFSETRESIV